MMPNCSDIQHAAGYFPNAPWGQKWSEIYYSALPDGQVVVHKVNHPPEGRRSLTPPSQVGLENGFCTISEPVANPASVVELPIQTEGAAPEVNPDTLPGGVVLVAILGACIVGGIALSRHQDEKRQKQYDRAASRSQWAQPVALADQSKQKSEDDLILEHLYRQSPAPEAVQAIWGVERNSSEYATKLRVFEGCRREFEQKLPGAKIDGQKD